MKLLARVGIPLLTAASLAVLGQRAATSPVVATVASSCVFDSTTGRYVYSYTITNSERSPNHIARFGVRPVAHALSTTAPEGWAAFRGWQSDTTAIVWAVVRAGPAPPNWRGQLFLGPFHLAPGSSLGHFSVESDLPPDSMGWFFVQGFDTIPRGAHAGRLRPSANKTLWQEGYRGRALVPGVQAAPRGQVEQDTLPAQRP